MRPRPAVYAVSLALLLQAPAFSQTRGSTDLATGIRQVEDGELEVAVATLDGVVRLLSAEKGRERDLATAHLYLGVAQLGLGQPERARSELREAWRSNKELTLDPKKFSPRVRRLYEEVRAEEAKKNEPAGSTASRTPAPPTQGPAPAAKAGKTTRQGGGHTGLILLGVGGAAVAGGALAAAGKGGSSNPTPASTTPSPALQPAGPSSAVSPITPNRGVFGLDFVSAQPAPGSTVAGFASAAAFAGSLRVMVSVANPTNVDARSCNAWVQLQSASAQCVRVSTAGTFDLAAGQSLQVLVGTPDMGAGTLANCPLPLRIVTMHVDTSCASGPIFNEVPGAPGYTGRDWTLEYQINP